jgi:hypothetical protein
VLISTLAIVCAAIVAVGSLQADATADRDDAAVVDAFVAAVEGPDASHRLRVAPGLSRSAPAAR